MCERNDVARGLRLQSGGIAPEGGVMDWNEAKSRWQAHRGDLARRWPRISERDIDAIAFDDHIADLFHPLDASTRLGVGKIGQN